jgi:hypothetical protein
MMYISFSDFFNNPSWSTIKLSAKIFSAKPDTVLSESMLKKWQWKHLFRLTETIRLNHQKCHYGALLKYYANPTDDNNIEPSRISAFLMSVLKRVLPSEMIKCSHFMNHIKKSKLIFNLLFNQFLELILLLLMPRFELVSDSDLLSSLKISKIAFIFDPKVSTACQSPSEHEKFKSLAKAFLWFIFQDFLIPLVNYNFYVTESSSLRTKLVFYRHEAWNRLSAHNLEEHLEAMFTPTNASSKIANFRMVPKENGKFRPIIAFKRNPLSVSLI